ncbi:MAG: hypothetical protein JRI52_08970 [Deltaproteobacteria bacterium]|nr:hypothetical protein [Deltaproteobacteria bacterium]
MISRLHQVASRIRIELGELDNILSRINEGWNRAKKNEDMMYLDSVALNLHGLYSGLERLFELIVMSVDGTMPEGENWHRELLVQVAKDVPQVRPSVISEMSRNALDEYRGFRHVVRNVYTINFDPRKIGKLVEKIPDMYNQLKNELLAFADFLYQAE